MVKRLFFIFIIVLSTSSCGSGANGLPVRDYVALVTTIEIHKSEFKKYKAIRQKELQKLGLETVITKWYKKISDLDKKIAKRYTSVASLLSHAGKITYAMEILNDIKDYQTKTVKMVIKNPELAGLAVKAEIAFLKRLNRLYKFIYLHAAVPGKLNLMSIKERLSVVDRVIEELRVLRGISYGLFRKMHYALKGDLLKKYMEEYDIKSYTLDLIEKRQIINDLKIW